MTERHPRRPPRAWRLARRVGRGFFGSRAPGALEPADYELLKRANQLAYEAEVAGNVPIGAVIALGGRVIAEGRNTVYLIEDPPWYIRGIQWLGPVRDDDSRELRRRVRRSLLRNG